MGRVREEKRREEKRREEKKEKRREEKRREEEERRSKKRKSQKKEDPGARKGRRVAKYCVFLMICGSGGSKSRLAKAAGAEPAGQMRDEKLHVVVARSTFLSQNGQNLELVMSKKRTPLCGAKLRSTCRSQKCKKIWVPNTFGRSDVVLPGRRKGLCTLSKVSKT